MNVIGPRSGGTSRRRQLNFYEPRNRGIAMFANIAMTYVLYVQYCTVEGCVLNSLESVIVEPRKLNRHLHRHRHIDRSTSTLTSVTSTIMLKKSIRVNGARAFNYFRYKLLLFQI